MTISLRSDQHVNFGGNILGQGPCALTIKHGSNFGLRILGPIIY